MKSKNLRSEEIKHNIHMQIYSNVFEKWKKMFEQIDDKNFLASLDEKQKDKYLKLRNEFIICMNGNISLTINETLKYIKDLTNLLV